MEDFTKKTDYELEEIMRNAAENSYVPGSAYNHAKREVESRHRKRVEGSLSAMADTSTNKKTTKRKTRTPDVFVETRMQDEDMHILIGARDSSGEKSHTIIDGVTGEQRVEDNQKDPTKFARKMETITILHDGTRVKATREGLDILTENPVIKIELDGEALFNLHSRVDGIADGFSLTIPIIIKNLSNRKITVRNIKPVISLPEGYQITQLYSSLEPTYDINPEDFKAISFSFNCTLIGRGYGHNDPTFKKSLETAKSSIISGKVLFKLSLEHLSIKNSGKEAVEFDITALILSELTKDYK